MNHQKLQSSPKRRRKRLLQKVWMMRISEYQQYFRLKRCQMYIILILSISPLIPKGKRQQCLYFSLPCEYQYPLRTMPSKPVWMHHEEYGEDVHEHVREFVHQVISQDPTLSSTIKDKEIFQQYLHCLLHKLVQENSQNKVYSLLLRVK